MKSYRPGRREILAFGSLGLVPRRILTTSGSPSAHRVEIRLLPTAGANDPAALVSSICVETQGAAEPVLRAARTGMTPLAELRAALTSQFKDAVSEEFLGVIYYNVWVEDHWERWCIETRSLGIDFGSEGTVDVEVEDAIRLPG